MIFKKGGMMEIRKINKDEIEQFYKLFEYAFRSWKEKEPQEDDLIGFNPERIIGCFDGDKLISGLINHEFRQSLRGIVKKMGGIGDVATYPEYRNKGIVRKLTLRAFVDMKNNGMSVSMLQPFRESYYQAYGYVSTNHNVQIEVPLDSFLQYLDYNPEGDWSEDRVPSYKAKDKFWEFMPQVAVKKYNGIVLFKKDSRKSWGKRFKDWIFIFINESGKTRAVARYKKVGFGKGYASVEDGKIIVRDMYWKDIKARNMLFMYFAKHRDQILSIEMEIPFGENFYSWLKDTMRPFRIRMDKSPWMVRLIDVEEALRDLPAENQGELIIKVRDNYCDWNNNFYKLESVNGKLEVSKTSQSSSLETNIEGITALAYGTFNIEELLERDWLTIKDRKCTEILSGWFPKMSVFNTYYF
jgi:predicted acetyltransferase